MALLLLADSAFATPFYENKRPGWASLAPAFLTSSNIVLASSYGKNQLQASLHLGRQIMLQQLERLIVNCIQCLGHALVVHVTPPWCLTMTEV